MNKLSGPNIGFGGQLMEWKDEVTKDVTGDGGHCKPSFLAASGLADCDRKERRR